MHFFFFYIRYVCLLLLKVIKINKINKINKIKINCIGKKLPSHIKCHISHIKRIYQQQNCGQWKCWMISKFGKPLATVAGVQKKLMSSPANNVLFSK